MRQSQGDHTMIVRPPCDVSVFESAGVYVLCCILFYTFEVSFQSKKRNCILLVHECPKIHDDHTATIQSPRPPDVSPTCALSYPCDFYVWLRRWHELHKISAWFPHVFFYGLTPVRCINLSKKLHDGRIEYKHILRSPQLPMMP